MKHMKLSDANRDWVRMIPKIINENGCHLPINRPTENRYTPIMIQGIVYQLHRLVVAIHYNLDYHDQSWDARHSTGCDKRCFFIDHLRPGTISDNVKRSS